MAQGQARPHEPALTRHGGRLVKLTGDGAGAPPPIPSVVDPQCPMIGATSLRVIDVSIMPTVLRADTHLTTIMIAEKMANEIGGR
jgi:hypothetical protein